MAMAYMELQATNFQSVLHLEHWSLQVFGGILFSSTSSKELPTCIYEQGEFLVLKFHPHSDHKSVACRQ